MTAYLRPGVYIQETLNPVQPTVGANSDSVAAFVGATDRGPLTPTLVTSWSQYAALYGTWNSVASNDLPLAVYSYFSNASAPAYILRVAGTGAAVATRTFNDRAGSPLSTLIVNSVNVGTWGNNINISITDSVYGVTTSAPTPNYFNMEVYYGGIEASNLVETWTDITMDPTDARYVLTVINSGSKYVSVELPSPASTSSQPTNNPATTSHQALSSSSDGSTVDFTAINAALPGFDFVKQSLIMNVAGQTDASVVNETISYAVSRGDIFVVVDGVNDTPGAQLTASESYTATSQAAVYYPRITISDPTKGLGSSREATLTIGAGGAVVGLYAATDASRGVFKAPAGLSTRISGAVSVAQLSNSQLDALNSDQAPVNAIRYIPGAGIVVMGSRTLKTGYVDRYVPVRRTLIYLEKALKDLTEFALFEPNDARLWRLINSTITGFLTNFWSQGGLSGGNPSQAFFVKVDSDINQQSSIDNGELHIEVGVSLQRPAEFVIIKIGQFNGTTTVTVA